MGIADMDRRMAQRVFQARADALKDKIRELPTVEKLRLAADFLAVGQRDQAVAVARLALSEIERPEPSAR